ncbi:magnesium/cobalt transporter CorA [uncultured Thiodictyon sp.]|uniref:magnesium/cobalt transporter CorA n=1 Tax=uncultured Thiodictyon sp. TaxID=1846217 RepID=UPI0025FCDB32|nr:magnesium/cobalt transporter CorA [uncultured Thiodictyon sp.]
MQNPHQSATPPSAAADSKASSNYPRHRVATHAKRHRLPWGAKAKLPRLHRPPPGTPAGIEYHELVQTPGAGTALVVCTDYSPDRWEVQPVADMAAFIATHRPDWSQVRWIQVQGLGDAATIRALAEKYQLHPLAIEDVLDGQHRPKADDYPGSGEQPGRLFVVARRVVQSVDDIHAEQVNFFLGRRTLLSFQSSACPAIEAVRRRIENPHSRLRQNDASFLLYAILDTIVDGLYPLLEAASVHLEEAEEATIDQTEPQTLHSIHRIKRGLILLRRVAWPMRELIGDLQRERHECLSEVTQTYFRDVYDHCVQVIDLIETYREIASDVADMHMSMLSNRTNEIMKVLTIIGTIFIPLTFIVGVYGMNMYIPENQWHYTYAVFWIVCLCIAGYMLWRFRRGGWF